VKYKLTILIFICIFTIFTGSTQITPSYDILIKSGKIINGTGNPWFFSDIGIIGERIVKIGKNLGSDAKKIVNAKDLYVVPGFIDVHTHVDRKIASNPEVVNYLLQGVTTVVGGNCGGSQFPLSELFTTLETRGIAINFASLIGHNTIRRKVMGNGNRTPTSDELSHMQELVKQEMLAGAIGFSTGLAYIPGRYSTTGEIIELVKMIQPLDGIYATHIRNQGKRIKQAIDEAIRIGREAGVAVEISHIKLASEDVWGRYHLITDAIEKARQQGFEIYMDQYPYTATSSGFTSSFPGWAVAGGHDSLLMRLESPGKYQKIKKSIIRKRLTSKSGIDKLKTIYVSNNINHSEYEGKNLSEILDLLGREKTVPNGAALIIEMQKTDHPRGVFFQMAKKDVATLMQKPYNMIASDGKVEIPGVQVPHPRAYGTFPRVLAKYVRESDVLSLPDAIRKMTSLPAQAMGFNERGILKPGMYADIVIFNAEKVQDTATFEKPHQYPQGIDWVIVNGKVAAQNGKWTEIYPGKVVYGSGKKQ